MTCRSSRIGETVSPSRSASRPALTRSPRSTSTEAASRKPASRTRLIRRSSSRRWWTHGRVASVGVPGRRASWKSIRPRGDARSSSRRTYARRNPLARSSFASSTNCQTRMSWKPEGLRRDGRGGQEVEVPQAVGVSEQREEGVRRQLGDDRDLDLPEPDPPDERGRSHREPAAELQDLQDSAVGESAGQVPHAEDRRRG